MCKLVNRSASHACHFRILQAGGMSAEFRLPNDTLAERTFVAQLEAPARFVASPSILELPSRRLLVLYEK